MGTRYVFRVHHKTAGSSCNRFDGKYISRAFFCRGFQLPRARRQKLAWRTGFSSHTHPRQPVPVSTRFPTQGFLLRANGRETAGKHPALAGRLLCGNALWVFAFSTQMPLASAEDYGVFSLPHARKKRIHTHRVRLAHFLSPNTIFR